MQAQEVKNFLEEKIPGAQVEVEGEGCNFQLNVISDELAGLSPVKRQQQIYAHLNPCIADGSMGRARLIAGGQHLHSFQAERVELTAPPPSAVLTACGLREYSWTN